MPIGVSRGPYVVLHRADAPYKIHAFGAFMETYFDQLDIVEAEQYAQDGEVGVSGHRVRRYPGDTGYLRGAHQRKKFINRGKSGSSATPGKRFWVEVAVLTDSGYVYTTHQATYTGKWRNLVDDWLAVAGPHDRLRRESSVVLIQPPPGP